MRRHHQEMKYLLASMAHEKPQTFLARFGGEEGPSFFRDLWDGFGLRLDESERVSSEGASIVAAPIPSVPFVLVFPPVAARNEARFFAVASAAESVRVFVAESSLLPSTGRELTMVVEVEPTGRKNYGPAADSTLESFVACIRSVLEGTGPLAIVPQNGPTAN
ncbi:hypothetical protein OAX78_03210 [Planctomycetota bacterium]|nr:hypothetical protein [Planctomycetota bacterium]